MNRRGNGRRPRLLFVCQTLPYPPDSGVAIRSHHTLRLLARAFDVTTLCFYRRKGGETVDDVAGRVDHLKEFGEVEAFPVPQEHSRWRLAWDHCRSVARSRVYTAFAYDARIMRRHIADLVATRNFALVHLDSIVLSPYLPLLRDSVVVCTHHNVESVLLRRRAVVEGRGLRRAYLSRQAQLMEREERQWCPRVRLNVVVSPNDRAQLERIAPTARCAVVPNGVDLEAFSPQPGRDEGIVFVGETTWFPNLDAMEYFGAEILPRIRAVAESVRVEWVGRASDERRREYAERFGVSLTGYVADVRPHVQAAACCVVPMRVGGGTRLKILDAWAMGKAIVSTSVGCEGLATVDGENILVRDDAASFAAAVCAVLRDPGLRRQLGEAGRRTVEAHYGWDGIGESMLPLYDSLLAPS